MRRGTAKIAYWTSYPLIILECALMASLVLTAYMLMRLAYASWWYPEHARQRPRRRVKGVIDPETALEAMQVIEGIGENTGAAPYWISGTLLGLERLGQPLPHDNDLDLGLNIDDPRADDFIQALWSSPHIASIAPQRLSGKARIQNPDLHAIPGGIIRYIAFVCPRSIPGGRATKIDIFLHFPYCGGSIHGTRNSIWWNSTSVATKRSYGERQFSVPQDCRLYLTENYGDYREEVKDFENAVDCPNVMNIFSWRSIKSLLSRMQMMIRLGRIDRAKQINERIIGTIRKGLEPFSNEKRIAKI